MQNSELKYRLVTRSNLDGLVSTLLLKKLDLIDDIFFVHPKEVQDGNVVIGAGDIVTNLPYVKNAHLAFDYKIDVDEKNIKLNSNHILFTDLNSVSEVIYEYYGGADVFSDELLSLVKSVNRNKAENETKEEILLPEDWDLLSFLTDSKTGLGCTSDSIQSDARFCQVEHKLVNLLKVKEEA